MPGPAFHETRMGVQFYTGTMPTLAKGVGEIANALSSLGPLMGVLQALVPAQPVPVTGRSIMVLPSNGGDDYLRAVLTPEGMSPLDAAALAEMVLCALEKQDEDNRGNDGYEEWTVENLMRALEAEGFLALDYFNGPVWDRRGA